MANNFSNEKFRRPQIAFQDILRKGAGGAYRERGEYSAFMFRALVVAVDTAGGKLETPTGVPHEANSDNEWVEGGKELEQIIVGPDSNFELAKYTITPTKGPVNPPNSIRAKIISTNQDAFVSDDELRCYWPMFPGSSNISAGELAYIIFEDENLTHGLWLARVPTNAANQTANQILMGDILKKAAQDKKTFFPDTISVTTSPSGKVIKQRDRLVKLFM